MLERYNQLIELQLQGTLTPSEESELAELEANLTQDDMSTLILGTP